MSEMNENNNKLTKFDGTNWYEFESDMMYFLMSKKLWKVVSEEKKKEDEQWEEKNMQAIGIIVSKVDQSIREFLREMEEASDIWIALRKMSESKSAIVIARIRT
jgi:hypothetical protein